MSSHFLCVKRRKFEPKVEATKPWAIILVDMNEDVSKVASKVSNRQEYYLI